MNDEKTLKFTKWIHDKAVELYGDKNAGYNADSKQHAEDLLAAYKKSLDDGNKLYFTRFSYEGDAMCYGHIYIADTDGWKKICKRATLRHTHLLLHHIGAKTEECLITFRTDDSEGLVIHTTLI